MSDRTAKPGTLYIPAPVSTRSARRGKFAPPLRWAAARNGSLRTTARLEDGLRRIDGPPMSPADCPRPHPRQGRDSA